MKKALLIVDIQNDFLPGGALGVHEGDKIIPLINQLQEKFDLIVASKDFHPKNHISFASRHNKKVGETVKLGELEQRLWPDHCVKGEKGAELSKALKTEKFAKVFHKGEDPNIDSYSAFFDNQHGKGTGLYEYLKKQNVETLYIVGLTTEYCVLYSALDAKRLGFEVKVILDACKGVELDPQDVPQALFSMTKEGVELLFSKEMGVETEVSTPKS